MFTTNRLEFDKYEHTHTHTHTHKINKRFIIIIKKEFQKEFSIILLHNSNKPKQIRNCCSCFCPANSTTLLTLASQAFIITVIY